MVKNSGGLNCQSEFVKLQPVAFSHRSVQIISLGFPQIFFHISSWILQQWSSAVFRLQQVSKDLENQQRYKAMIFQYQMEGKAFKCVDALVLLCICIYICICIYNCILCGKQSSQVTRDKTIVGD